MEREKQEAPSRQRTPEDGKKPYAPPRLIVYGSLAELTRTDDADDISGPIGDESDRNIKEGFAPVDPAAILARVATLPIETWSYKAQKPAIRHIGPMAQDFAAAFSVGEDDRHIHSVDASGVALAAIQGLHRLVLTQAAQVQALTQEVTALQAANRALWTEMCRLATAPPVTPAAG
jgi:hypothetical protein